MNSKTAFRCAQILLCIAIATQTGCVTPGLTKAKVAMVNVTVGDGGFYFSTEDKAYEVSRGVPQEWFVLKPKGWYLTQLQETEAADIVQEKENPGVWK